MSPVIERMWILLVCVVPQEKAADALLSQLSHNNRRVADCDSSASISKPTFLQPDAGSTTPGGYCQQNVFVFAYARGGEHHTW